MASILNHNKIWTVPMDIRMRRDDFETNTSVAGLYPDISIDPGARFSDKATTWSKSTRCESHECVEVRKLDSGVVIRNSNNPAVTAAFSNGHWRNFVQAVKVGGTENPMADFKLIETSQAQLAPVALGAEGIVSTEANRITVVGATALAPTMSVYSENMLQPAA